MNDEVTDRLRHDLDGLHLAPDVAAAVLARRRSALRRRRVAVAGIAVLGVLTGTALVVSQDSPSRAPDTLVPLATPSAVTPRTGNQALVVRDGDRVRLSGYVAQAQPSAAVEFCSDNRVLAAASASGPGTVPTLHTCNGHGIDLLGVDLAALSKRQELNGAVTGYASLGGVYRAGAITVDVQGPPQPVIRLQEIGVLDAGGLVNAPTPCPEPTGGWRRGAGAQDDQSNALAAYQEAHPGELLLPYFDQPEPGVSVLVLLVKDEAARTALERRFRPVVGRALCLAIADPSLAQAEAAQTAFRAGLQLQGPFGNGLQYDADLKGFFVVDALIMDDRLADFADLYPPGIVRLDPQVRPVF